MLRVKYLDLPTLTQYTILEIFGRSGLKSMWRDDLNPCSDGYGM